MLFITTDKIKYSTVGASFTVTFTVAPEEINYLMDLHDKYMEMNMKSFILEPQNDCDTCKHNIDEDEGDYDVYCKILAIEDDCRYEPIDTIQGTGDCDHCSRLFVDCDGR